jgi:hypothetical protein
VLCKIRDTAKTGPKNGRRPRALSLFESPSLSAFSSFRRHSELSAHFEGMASSDAFSSQGSTIYVDPPSNSTPSRRCTKCSRVFPATAAYFKAFKKGTFAAHCTVCATSKSSGKPAVQPAGGVRGRPQKRKVLGELDANVQSRKELRLAPRARQELSQRTYDHARQLEGWERANRARLRHGESPLVTLVEPSLQKTLRYLPSPLSGSLRKHLRHRLPLKKLLSLRTTGRTSPISTDISANSRWRHV